MSTFRESLTIDDFSSILHALDDSLSASGYGKRVTIHAVGGFAMLWHGLRTTGVTGDIDSITPDYDFTVSQHVAEVAKMFDLEPDWLNNDAVFTMDDYVTEEDVECFDAMLEAHYDKIDFGLKLIDISVADLDTLAKSKAYAVNDIGIGRTGKDLDDLCNVFHKVGCDTLGRAVNRYIWLSDPEFSLCRGRLKAVMSPSSKPAVNHDRLASIELSQSKATSTPPPSRLTR